MQAGPIAPDTIPSLNTHRQCIVFRSNCLATIKFHVTNKLEAFDKPAAKKVVPLKRARQLHHHSGVSFFIHDFLLARSSMRLNASALICASINDR
jgi:hypothetical protein